MQVIQTSASILRRYTRNPKPQSRHANSKKSEEAADGGPALDRCSLLVGYNRLTAGALKPRLYP